MDVKELKQRKNNLKLTTARLAELAELPVGTVSKIMTGETKNPTITTIDKIDKALAGEELRRRLIAYRQLFEQYINGHPLEKIDLKRFQKTHYDGPVKGNGQRVDASVLNEFGEDKTVEILDGYLIFNQSPGIAHQRLVQNIGKKIDQFIEKHHGPCQMFNVGVNVKPDEDDYTVLIPDIAVICNPEMIRDDCIFGPPDWIIEVTSPSTRHRDYNEKMHKYMASGVREYWIVDPEKERVITYIEGEPMMAYVYGFDESIPVYIYDGKLKIRV